jgi:hypothetical protein
MFKLPAGDWEVVKEVPAPYNAFTVGKKPDVVLAARVRPAVIKIWVERSSIILLRPTGNSETFSRTAARRHGPQRTISISNTSFSVECLRPRAPWQLRQKIFRYGGRGKLGSISIRAKRTFSTLNCWRTQTYSTLSKKSFLKP